MERYKSIFLEGKSVSDALLESSARIPRSDLDEFNEIVNKIIRRLESFDNDQLDEFQELLMDNIEDRLDPELVSIINRFIGSMKPIGSGELNHIMKALDNAYMRHGTDPKDAIIAATMFLGIVYRKMNRL